MPVAPEHDGGSFVPLLVLCGAPWVAALILLTLGRAIGRGGRRLLAFSTTVGCLLAVLALVFRLEREAGQARWPGWRWLSLSGVDEAGFMHAGVEPEVQGIGTSLISDGPALTAASMLLLVALATFGSRRPWSSALTACWLALLGLCLAAVCGAGLIGSMCACAAVSMLLLLVDGAAPATPRLRLSLMPRAADFALVLALVVLLKHAETAAWDGLQQISWGLAYPATFWDSTSPWLPGPLRTGSFAPASVVTVLFVAACVLQVASVERVAARRGAAMTELWAIAAVSCVLTTLVLDRWVDVAEKVPATAVVVAVGGGVLVAIGAWPRSTRPCMTLVRALVANTGLAWLGLAAGAGHQAWVHLLAVVTACCAMSAVVGGVPASRLAVWVLAAVLVGVPGTGAFSSRASLWGDVLRLDDVVAGSSVVLLPLVAAATVVGSAQAFVLARSALRRGESAVPRPPRSLISGLVLAGVSASVAYVDAVAFSAEAGASVLDYVFESLGRDFVVPAGVLAAIVLGGALGRAALLPVSSAPGPRRPRRFDPLRRWAASTASIRRATRRRTAALLGGARMPSIRVKAPLILGPVLAACCVWFAVPHARATTHHAQDSIVLRAASGYGYTYEWTASVVGAPAATTRGRTLELRLAPGQEAWVELRVSNSWGWTRTHAQSVMRPKRDGSVPGETLQLEISEDGQLRPRRDAP